MKSEEQSNFERFAQTRYDFNLNALTGDDISEIRTLSREKRVDYGVAPIGKRIFRFIKDNAPDISFVLTQLHDDIDAILYIPHAGAKRAYIILNSEQPLVNQIFAAAHEYYHYIKDYEDVRNKPLVCSLSSLQSVIEQKASRFAAEFLLPTEALLRDIEAFKTKHKIKKLSTGSIGQLAIIAIILSVKYEMPIKAILYRLCEEGFVNDIEKTMQHYDFIKSVLLGATLHDDDFKELFNPLDKNFFDYEIYDQLYNAYRCGLVSREQLLADSNVLGLEEAKIQIILDENCEEPDNDDDQDDDTLDKMLGKWGDR